MPGPGDVAFNKSRFVLDFNSTIHCQPTSFLLTRVLRTIKSGDFTVLPNYELSCYSFMGAGRVHKTSGSEGCCLCTATGVARILAFLHQFPERQLHG